MRCSVDKAWKDSGADYAPGLYVVDLVPDLNCSYPNPTYNNALLQLKGYLSNNVQGNFEGLFAQNERGYPNMAVINIKNISLIPKLQKLEYIATDGLPGHYRDITPINDITIHEIDYEALRI